ncbi:unnamed protein product [Heligmosomoides polygyrus]|uniref:Transposase n=1 Tax=Heligmosomoides polygyrus TaxID=6339 RepID=A0A183G5V4_HELPZ|nr:unnamed protein product [Heligmosomoides polygyrus]
MRLHAFYEAQEEVARNEKSFFKFGVGDFNAKIVMARKRSRGSKDLNLENITKTTVASLGFYPPFSFSTETLSS